MNPSPALTHLMAILREQGEGGLALACSGGVDSAVLAWAARRAGVQPLLAVYFATPLNTPEDRQSALRVAEELDIPLELLQVDVLQLPAIRMNRPDRCYYCKRELFGRLLQLAERRGIAAVAEGGNADDLHTHRPGSRACQELGILRPLAEAGLTKAEIRALARAAALSVAERPSSPCLASRFPYDTALTRDQLDQVSAGEAFLRSLGFGEFRLRCHGDLCRIELPPERWPDLLALRQQLLPPLQELGWKHITFDLEGFNSGSFDR